MKILLCTATRESNPASIKAIDEVFTVSESLGIAYIAAVLIQNGYDVEVLDCLAEGYDSGAFQAFLLQKKYDVIGISTYTPDWYITKKNLSMIKRLQPDSITVIGGPHVNSMVSGGLGKYLFSDSDFFDFAVYGEGEQTFLDIVRAVADKKDINNIDGVLWKNSNGQGHINLPRKLIKDIDTIPFPALECLPLSKYKRTPSSYKRPPVRSILTTRGCPYSCIFCDRGAFGSFVRQRSIENVMREVDRLVKEFKTKELRIWDDVFTMNEKVTTGICDELKRYDLVWSCNGRVNMITPNMLKHMKSAGCWSVDFGIESGSNKILKLINKKFTIQKASEAIKMVKKAGMEVRAFFILGLPEETIETVQDTIDFALSSDIDYATFYLPQAYPGTRLYEIAKKENALETDYSKYLITGKEASYVNKNIGLKNIQLFQRKAYASFYKRPSYIAKRILKIRSFEDIKRYLSAISIFKI
ncbi:MAG: radical SAM protein [Candidatus Gorgyraea atricola]|nr:radical SAM protein [Candidatus Gorgyraea atricola]